MGLTAALSAAVSGLRTTQTSLNVTAQNVANANSVGYSRRITSPVQQLAGGQTAGVREGEIRRVLDLLTQRQLRLELAGASFTSSVATYARQLDRLFGTPGEAGALDSIVNDFTGSLQALLNDSGSTSARSSVLDKAGVLASQLSRLSDSVQALRTEAEGSIGLAVERVNELLTGIANANQRIVSSPSLNDPGLLDERDRLINELSQLVDVQATYARDGSVSLSTTAGLTLFDGSQPVRLTFDGRSNLTPQSVYSTDPAVRTVGTITVVNGSGTSTDAIANGLIRSGEIAALIESRDKTLVQAQRQLDELAAGLSRALSDFKEDGTALPPGPPDGFSIDLAGWQPGNTLTLDHRQGATTGRIIFLATNGGTPAGISGADLGDPGATVIPVNIGGGFGAAAAAIQAALTGAGIAITVTNPASSTLQFVDDGVPNTSDVTSLSATKTETTLASGRVQVPLFVDNGDGNRPFTGSFDGGSHLTGLAQRLAINPAVKADPQRLVVYGASIPQGDTARPQHLLDSLTKTQLTFTPGAGLSGTAAFTSTVTGFARRTVETQGANAEHAERLEEGQSVALKAIESRFAEDSGVNIDQELAQLVQLQTAYGANARVMTAVRELLDLLTRI